MQNRMKNKIFLLIVLMITIKCFSQDYSNSQISNPNILPPDVSSFQKVNFLPVSNYTGRANVEIPFYNVELGGLKIPIGLSYNTGGVKSNDVASSVGLNWSLNAGGMISKVVKGVDDFTRGWAQYYDWESHITYLTGAMGWLSYYTKFPAPYMTEINGGDSLPDVFNVSAPNINFSYIHNRTSNVSNYGIQSFSPSSIEGTNQNGQAVNLVDTSPMDGAPFILDGDNSYKIEETYNNVVLGMWGMEQGMSGMSSYLQQFWTDNNGAFDSNHYVYGINSITIKTIDGFQYIFDKIQSSQYVYDRDITHLETLNTLATSVNIVSYQLSKIIDMKTNMFVEFQYESYSQSFSEIIDNSATMQGTNMWISSSSLQYPSGTSHNPNQKGIWQKYPKLNRIKKIIFDKGYIDFNYNLNRDDLPGEKALTDITLYDKNNNQIKKAILNFEYFQSNIAPNSPFSKRLKLKDVTFQGSTPDVNEKYKLTYNTTLLPLRVNAITDFFGYNNGEAYNFTYNLGNGDYVNNPPSYNNNIPPNPIIYFHKNYGQNSFLPFRLNIDAIQTAGNYSLESNLAFCKAGILEKIEYPTGGYIALDYELNKFKLNNIEVEGGGLRVKSENISDGNTVRTLKFEYKNADNTSSGSVLSLPKFVDFDYGGPLQSSLPVNMSPTEFNNWFYLCKSNYPKANVELTNGAYVGYSRVKVFEENKGYTLYNYTAPDTFSNLQADAVFSSIPDYYTPFLNTNNYKKIYYDHGKVDLIFDNDVFRGKLMGESVFNQQNQRLKETLYQYTVKEYKNLLIVKSFDSTIANEIACQIDRGTNGNSGSECYSLEYGYFKQRRYLLTNVIENEYFNGQLITKNKDIEYDDNFTLVKKENMTDNYYPHDAINQSEFGMSNLTQADRKSERILSYNFKNNEKILEEKAVYANFNGLILPKQIKKFKSGSLNNSDEINSLEITLRDNLGNICEVTDKTGNKTSFIWGYNQTAIIAKIENASYVSIPTSIISTAQSYSNTGTELQLKGMLDILRSTMTNAITSTYTYKPLIGISTITDPKGDVIIYEYDVMGRLKTVRDRDNNIISENDYHYKPQN
jgi:hypothetical protein